MDRCNQKSYQECPPYCTKKLLQLMYSANDMIHDGIKDHPSCTMTVSGFGKSKPVKLTTSCEITKKLATLGSDVMDKVKITAVTTAAMIRMAPYPYNAGMLLKPRRSTSMRMKMNAA